MNAVEIESAISELAAQPFVAAEFPYAFLAAFGNKETTLKRIPLHTSPRLAELSGVAGALDKDGYLLQAQP